MPKVARLMDPEALICFAEIPGDLPSRFVSAAYPVLWQRWLDTCANGPTREDNEARAAAIKTIKARPKGWCSQADLLDAGFLPDDGRRMLDKEFIAATFKRLIDAEPYA